MKCYYEILGICRDAGEDVIKKAYRNLALRWHPDKNPDNSEEATIQFQLLQQAYEVLSDSQERSWYDRHRDSILNGRVDNNYKDDAIDVFQYFTTSCFVGYNDDVMGFYSVYREVFNRLSAEDSEYNFESDSDFEIPNFGTSNSSYDDVVRSFYSYWEGYCTKKSYVWLNIYDIREAPNRKIAKALEKENKKVRDKAKKERNEEIRALVKFVKKRDKRVNAYSKFLKEKKLNDLRKYEEQRALKMKQKQEAIAAYKESEWAKFSNLENELKGMEESLAIEFGDLSENEPSSENQESTAFENDSLYCVACNKLFKSTKAFLNHEQSKKHKDKVTLIKLEMSSDSSFSFTQTEEDTAEHFKSDHNEDHDVFEKKADPLSRISSDFDEVEMNKSITKTDKRSDTCYNESVEVDYNLERLSSDDSIDFESPIDSDLSYCFSCDKLFKSNKALKDHKKSKKHIATICNLDLEMAHLNINVNQNEENKNNMQGEINDSDNEWFVKKNDKKKKKSKYKRLDVNEDKVDKSDTKKNATDHLLTLQVKNKSKAITKERHFYGETSGTETQLCGESNNKIYNTNNTDLHYETARDRPDIPRESYNDNVENSHICVDKTPKKCTNKDKSQDHTNTCITCNISFPSKNKLFGHINSSGHAVFVADNIKNMNVSKVKKGKSNTKK